MSTPVKPYSSRDKYTGKIVALGRREVRKTLKFFYTDVQRQLDHLDKGCIVQTSQIFIYRTPRL